MSENKIRISIIDDHPVVAEGLATMFAQQETIEVVAVYTDVKKLLDEISGLPPDILVMDIQMPEMNGEELMEVLLKDFPKIKVITLTYLDSLYYARSMVRKGVQGYLLKTCSATEIVKAVKAVYNGDQYIEEALKEKILQQALLNKKQVSNIPVLTRRELEILQLMASNFNSFEIAQKLFLSKRTVEHHRANMLLKLKVKNAPALIKKAVELNLL
jgi:DNA-binding NarL/FixJ family response regulator